MKITAKQVQVVRECMACGAVEVDNDTLFVRWKDLKKWNIQRKKGFLLCAIKQNGCPQCND